MGTFSPLRPLTRLWRLWSVLAFLASSAFATSATGLTVLATGDLSARQQNCGLLSDRRRTARRRCALRGVAPAQTGCIPCLFPWSWIARRRVMGRSYHR